MFGANCPPQGINSFSVGRTGLAVLTRLVRILAADHSGCIGNSGFSNGNFAITCNLIILEFLIITASFKHFILTIMLQTLQNARVMRCFIALFSLLFFVLISDGLIAQRNQHAPNFVEGSDAPGPFYQPVQIKLGFNLGWGFPYSAGIEFSALFLELFDVNAGVGAGMSGWKYGGGARFYPLREAKFSPMIGVFLYHATGLQELNVNNDFEQATFRITPDEAVLLNGGARMRFGHGNYLTLAAGYIFPFAGEQAVRTSGSNSPQLQSAANALATSGFSFNVGIQIKLSKGHYKLN